MGQPRAGAELCGPHFGMWKRSPEAELAASLLERLRLAWLDSESVRLAAERAVEKMEARRAS